MVLQLVVQVGVVVGLVLQVVVDVDVAAVVAKVVLVLLLLLQRGGGLAWCGFIVFERLLPSQELKLEASLLIYLNNFSVLEIELVRL